MLLQMSYTYGANNDPVSMTRGGKTYYYQTNYRGGCNRPHRLHWSGCGIV
ncbi:hypothetical protein GCM10007416_17140 [Kroppenstedtia guangzhouensis]|uniref:Uncharacterized protein n=1 Tax=Kroppenstedtia guangzhouensis TaxID=1274356 RepID=A0ABQ1GIS0_9BACL|nr:hypothetical protein [Kroppenstedtia guangzhouensis]GGA44646.1 hypothetical protein GCM10007416_17140 [Kroppenstedtia guangzhouensis]